MVGWGKNLSWKKLGSKTNIRISLGIEIVIEESKEDKRWKREEER